VPRAHPLRVPVRDAARPEPQRRQAPSEVRRAGGQRLMARRVITALPNQPAEADHLLVVDDLRTRFRTDRGLVRAVDGVSFSLDRGKTLGIVGESGSGKTVLSRSIMGLLPGKNVEITGSVLYEGRDITG